MEYITLTTPVPFLGYLANNNTDGLIGSEIDLITSFLADKGLKYIGVEGDAPFFSWHNSFDDKGGDCIEVTFERMTIENNFDPAWYAFTGSNIEVVYGWFESFADASQYLDILGDRYRVERLYNVTAEADKRYQALCAMTSEYLNDIYMGRVNTY